jgi:voltage-gated potassium channel Kch
MYSVENEAQPDVFRNVFSGLWWSVSTILTVGYGDIYPVTLLGKCMAIVISILGVGCVAIPTGIISAGFVEQHTKLETAGLMESVNAGKNENLCEKILRDRDNTDPETRQRFDDYLRSLMGRQ